MKIFLAIKFYQDASNRSTIEGLLKLLDRPGIQTVTSARDYENWGQLVLPPAELMKRTFAEIDTSNLVLMELSEKGIGLGIEAGYAYAKGIPLVIIARSDSNISATIQGIVREIIFYHDFEDLAQKIAPYLI